MKLRAIRNKQDGAAHLILIIVAVVVIVGGIGAYVATGGLKKKDAQNSTTTQAALPFTAKTATTSTDIKAMFTAARAGSYDVKCNYTDDSGFASSIYMSGTKLRVDTSINKKPGHMIWLDDKAYIWADGDSKGTILPVTKDKDDSTKQADKFSESVDKYKMLCQNVKHVDAGLFKVPTNVSFTTFSPQSSTYSSGN